MDADLLGFVAGGADVAQVILAMAVLDLRSRVTTLERRF